MQEEERSALIIKPSAMRVNQKKKEVMKKTKKITNFDWHTKYCCGNINKSTRLESELKSDLWKLNRNKQTTSIFLQNKTRDN